MLPTKTTVALVEIPESLDIALQAYCTDHPERTAQSIITCALSLYLLQNANLDPALQLELGQLYLASQFKPCR